MLIDGKKLAREIEEQTRDHIQRHGTLRRLVMFVVDPNPVIKTFVRLKRAYGERVGVVVDVLEYPGTLEEHDLITEITTHSKNADGIVVQLPLPPHMDRYRVLSAIPQEKDIDMLGEKRYRNFISHATQLLPPVVGAISHIFKKYKVSLSGKNIVVVGEGFLVGKPLADWFRLNKYSFRAVTETTPEDEKKKLYRDADVIISGIGVPESVTEDMVSPGVVLIDVGAGVQHGKVVGDISHSCEKKASLFSAVPGGVGPLTIAMLFWNLIYTNEVP